MAADVHKLAKMLQELDDQMVTCMKCGMCQAVCPVFAETMKEADVTRGKIALLENLAHEMISDPKGVQDKLNMCLLCGSCAANCPSGVKVMDIFLKARAIVNGYMGLPAAKKAILRGMLTKPTLFNGLVDMASTFQGLFVSKADDMIGTSCSKLMSPIIGDRHFMPLAKKSLHKMVKSMDTPAGKSGLRVAFFPGCLLDKMYPRIAEAVFKVLEHHGVGVFMPEKQACCGIPSLASGDLDSYHKLVGLNLKAFEGGKYDYFITACASCTSTIKELWEKMGDDYPADMKAKVKEIADKTMDVNQFVVDVLGVKAPAAAPKGGKKVTYHDPCHLKKSLGVSAQPRELLKTNPDYEFVEMNEADKCCGMGGTFNLNHYEMSRTIGQHKRDNIVASGARVVTAGCPACMHQITDMLSQNHDSVAIKHPIEIYPETL